MLLLAAPFRSERAPKMLGGVPSRAPGAVCFFLFFFKLLGGLVENTA